MLGAIMSNKPTVPSVPLRYIHHRLPEGRVISIGFTVPENKQGKMLLVFSFCSDQDMFSRMEARNRIHKRIEFNHPKNLTVEQNLGEHINDTIVRAWNANKEALTPAKWKKTTYPGGVTMDRIGKQVNTSLAGMAG
jgi:hypothetical protein